MEIKMEHRPTAAGYQVPAPAKATAGAAGFDLCAAVDAPVELPPGGRVVLPAGFAIEIPTGFVGLVFARSGLSIRQGIALSNGVGVIDSDYRGEVQVGLENRSDKSFCIGRGERIAQLLIVPVPDVSLVEGVVGQTARGTGGLGSTGRDAMRPKG